MNIDILSIIKNSTNFKVLNIDTNNNFTELCKIGSHFHSDKCPYAESTTSRHKHAYTPIYDSLFSPFKNQNINVAEIGIDQNDSINLWRNYFTAATIYGFDNNSSYIHNAIQQNLQNVHYYELDVAQSSSIKSTFETIGVKYDILIDDSSHNFEDQISLIKNSINFLKPDGLLIIEDVYKNIDRNKYIEALKDVQKYFYSGLFICPEHENQNSENWNNDQLFILMRNDIPVNNQATILPNTESKIFIITPCTRPLNLTTISKTIPSECVWVVVLDSKVKHDYHIDNAIIIKSDSTGFYGNPNRNIGLDYIQNNLNPQNNDWIYILDDDNIIHPDWWQCVKQYINENHALITWGQNWPDETHRTDPTDKPERANIDTAQYLTKWNIAKELRFEHDYEADGTYANIVSQNGSVKMLNTYISYYNFLRQNKYQKAIRLNICMIAMFKNEAKGIRRMLESVWRSIDFYVFQDNGSTDGTPQIVEEFFRDKHIPGFIYNVEEGWVGFGWNRDHLLQKTLNTDHGCDWIMKMDCDEYLEVDDDFDWSYLWRDVDAFHVTAQSPGCIYYRAWIWNAKLPWKFQHDDAHEIIYLEDRGQNYSTCDLPKSFRMIGTNDGESYTVRTKYISDALKIEETMIREETMLSDLYHFWYIGKSYADCYGGDFYPLGKAHSEEFARRSIFYFQEYLKFIQPEGIHESAYFTCCSIGQTYRYLNQYDLAIEWLNKAEPYCPRRNEHLVYLAEIYRDLKLFDKMYEQTEKLVSPDRTLPFPEYYFLINTNFYIDSGIYPLTLHNFAMAMLNKMPSFYGIRNLFDKEQQIKGIEIGCLYGDTTQYLLNYFPKLQLIGIDPYEDYSDWNHELKDRDKEIDILAQKVNPYKDRFALLKTTSDKAHPFLADDSFDFVFIDGLHTYDQVLTDCRNYYSKIKSGGILSGHDYYVIEEVRNAVNEFAKECNIANIQHTDRDVWYWVKP